MTIKNARVLAVIAEGPCHAVVTNEYPHRERLETPQEYATRCVLVAAEENALLCDSNKRASDSLVKEQPWNAYVKACAAEAESIAISIRADFGLGEKP